MNLTAPDAREAERNARQQRIELAYLLRGDEAKAGSARGAMAVRRLLAAAGEKGVTYDVLLGEHGTQALFDSGSLWFARPGE